MTVPLGPMGRILPGGNSFIHSFIHGFPSLKRWNNTMRTVYDISSYDPIHVAAEALPTDNRLLRSADSTLPYEFVMMNGNVCELTVFKFHLEDILIQQRKAVEGHTQFSGSVHSDSDCCAYANVLLMWSYEAWDELINSCGTLRGDLSGEGGLLSSKHQGELERGRNSTQNIHKSNETPGKIRARNTKSVVGNNPTPVGFKDWVIAQHSYFLRHITSLRITSSPRQISSVPLERQGHGATGTAHPNRGISKELKEAKGSDKAGAGPLQYNEVEAIPTVDGFVPQIVWKDYSLVLFLSTVHTGADEYKEAEEMTGQ
ncbi:hypothetical protein FOXB_16038 [Fusarium oxysporum f. sp. conglutinans Fo5176]|uniref:Uncharacterized protein n=1 Tax=Fusarium oxysporum (strain Fo5176) TaxID=660025 RepID=F9GBK5_FUSOF|nr:hypothetical protein FOXB_16038 [Fusarium oxysporum f. sp. conglutinans Fo5176]